MKLEKALKNLKAGREDCGMIPPEEYTPTIDLAIEALTRQAKEKREIPDALYNPLPGETKE